MFPFPFTFFALSLILLTAPLPVFSLFPAFRPSVFAPCFFILGLYNNFVTAAAWRGGYSLRIMMRMVVPLSISESSTKMRP